MRGPRFLVRICYWLGRITPAYAGTTTGQQIIYNSPRDHPRVCGDHVPRRAYRPRLAGSPPRMRGPPLTLASGALSPRITPAYAGTTQMIAVTVGGRGDHPRVCGDHTPLPRGYFSIKGSPPRMRGPRSASWRYPSKLRITPAYAGTTSSERGLCTTARDHPRVCGDHS